MIQIDIELPNSCSECRFETEAGYCKAIESGFCGSTTEEGRPEWCPLKEQEAQSVLSNRVCEVEPFRYVRKGFCPKCHQEMEWLFNRKYCGFCGQEVKWE